MKDYTFKKNTEKKRYELDLGDGALAVIDYYKMPGGAVAFTHTHVPFEFENKGIGSELAKRALQDVKDSGDKVIPQCGFIASYVRRHPEWNEIVY